MSKTTKERLILPALLVLVLLVGVVLLRQCRQTPPPPPMANPVAAAGPSLREVILYFSTTDSTQLVAETRELEGCVDDAACLRETVQALVAGPRGDLLPVWPSSAVVLGVTVQEATATVDLSREAFAAHPGGSMAELLSVNALAATLAVNFPYVRQLRILAEGGAVESIKGHVDLRQPLPVDFRLVRPETAKGTAAVTPEPPNHGGVLPQGDR